MTMTGPAVPWSVPAESLASGRRPNSDHVATTTRLRIAGLTSEKKLVSESSRSVRSCACQSFWSECVSKPPMVAVKTRQPRSALMRLAAIVSWRRRFDPVSPAYAARVTSPESMARTFMALSPSASAPIGWGARPCRATRRRAVTRGRWSVRCRGPARTTSGGRAPGSSSPDPERHARAERDAAQQVVVLVQVEPPSEPAVVGGHEGAAGCSRALGPVVLGLEVAEVGGAVADGLDDRRGALLEA